MSLNHRVSMKISYDEFVDYLKNVEKNSTELNLLLDANDIDCKYSFPSIFFGETFGKTLLEIALENRFKKLFKKLLELGASDPFLIHRSIMEQVRRYGDFSYVYSLLGNGTSTESNGLGLIVNTIVSYFEPRPRCVKSLSYVIEILSEKNDAPLFLKCFVRTFPKHRQTIERTIAFDSLISFIY